MFLTDWFKNIGKKDKDGSVKVDLKTFFFQTSAQLYVRELAFYAIVNKIANAIAKCELRTYENNKQIKGKEWYRWNVRPNNNQNATQFWNKLVNMLFSHNEALIVAVGDKLYVADSYSINEDATLFDYYFEDVTVDNLCFNKRFYMSDVFYFKLNDVKLKTLLNGTMDLYGKLLNIAVSTYSGNSQKGVLYIDQFAAQQDNFQENFEKLMRENFKTFFDNPNAVLPLFTGYKYEPVENGQTKTDSSDFRNLVTDSIAITASAMNVPKSIAIGDVQDTSKAIEEFLTFCIDPLLELICDELNGKLYSRDLFLAGYRVSFNSTKIKHIDILDMASSIDKAISSGCYSVNEIRIVCGDDPIDEPWANKHYITKNYEDINNLEERG